MLNATWDTSVENLRNQDALSVQTCIADGYAPSYNDLWSRKRPNLNRYRVPPKTETFPKHQIFEPWQLSTLSVQQKGLETIQQNNTNWMGMFTPSAVTNN